MLNIHLIMILWKKLNNNKQMKDVWATSLTKPLQEKKS